MELVKAPRPLSRPLSTRRWSHDSHMTITNVRGDPCHIFALNMRLLIMYCCRGFFLPRDSMAMVGYMFTRLFTSHQAAVHVYKAVYKPPVQYAQFMPTHLHRLHFDSHCSGVGEICIYSTAETVARDILSAGGFLRCNVSVFILRVRNNSPSVLQQPATWG